MKYILALLLTVAMVSTKAQIVEYQNSRTDNYDYNAVLASYPIFGKNIFFGTGLTNDKKVPLFVKYYGEISNETLKPILSANFGYLLKIGTFTQFQFGAQYKKVFALFGLSGQEFNKQMNFGMAINVGVKF